MQIQNNCTLHDKNWFQTGGNARFFAEPTTLKEFQEAIQFSIEYMVPVFILGQGANLLVHDNGFNGLVIRLNNQSIEFLDNGLVTVGAGVAIPDLIQQTLAHGYVGLEEFSGIPGSVGGSVYINIHYFEYLLSQFLVAATVISRVTGQVMQVDNAWFQFGYNQSTLQNSEWVLFDATFALRHVSPLEAAFAQGRRIEIIRHREKRYPHARTCGSFFRNFVESEVPFLTNGKKVIFVAYYLERVGVKGSLRIGNVIVTHQHANMLVTLPGATSDEVVRVAQEMQRRVYTEFGLLPQAECQLLGFERNPFEKIL